VRQELEQVVHQRLGTHAHLHVRARADIQGWHWKKDDLEERTFGKLSSCIYDSKTGKLSAASWWNVCCPKTLAQC
jgi:hypothetical protein